MESRASPPGHLRLDRGSAGLSIILYLPTVARHFPPRSCKSGDEFPGDASSRGSCWPAPKCSAPEVALCIHDRGLIDRIGALILHVIEGPEYSLAPSVWSRCQFVKSVFCGAEEIAVGIEEQGVGSLFRWICEHTKIVQNGLGVPVGRGQFEDSAGANLGSTF